MTPEQPAAFARRHPWTVKHPNEIDTIKLSPEEAFVVDWTVSDPSPGMYGWRVVSHAFATREEALAVAEPPMGVARSVAIRHIIWRANGSVLPRSGCSIIYSRKNSSLTKKRRTQ